MYDRVVVLDFEACCDEKRTYYEIIEFPSVLLNLKSFQVESEYQQFVKTTVYPTINKICKEITGISQEQVDNGLLLKDTLTSYEQWLKSNKLIGDKGEKIGSWCYVTCGDWDLLKALPTETKHKKLTYPPCMKQWINIKREFAIHYMGAVYSIDQKTSRPNRNKKEKGMDGMLKHLKLELKGHHHSGIDDCRNIGQVVVKMIQDGHTQSFASPNNQIN
ncbi:hypothetical protein AKO1_008168 [Acrasis kona]|uniref:Exonuclease domain-containing protein n=1 Tax=Acrasis kona TaxID=1008807 RepID=A0AAW2YN90_9EUKA